MSNAGQMPIFTSSILAVIGSTRKDMIFLQPTNEVVGR